VLFSSPIFIFGFLPVILILYYITPKRCKNVILLLMSLLFYAWGETFYLGIMLVSILVTYVIGLLIYRYKSNHYYKWALITSGVLINFGLLFFYKYADFLVENFNVILVLFDFQKIDLDPVHLPLGISFFTFQSICYLVDVHRKSVEPQRSLLDLALYISFFPQLIAGPIVRFSEIHKQIEQRVHSVSLFANGVHIFIFGLAKKMLIANPLGVVVDDLFSLSGTSLTMPLAWLGVVSFAIQVYFDFSGYSDMAIGLGKMFGFKLPINFNYPYVSKNLSEFWGRWHITLSTWFRDYVFYSMGIRVSPYRFYLQMMIVFTLTGLWHGAQWHYVFFGFFHGSFLVLESMGLSKFLKKLWRPMQHIYLLMVVLIGMVLFRSASLEEAGYFIIKMFDVSNFYTSELEFAKILSNEFIISFCIGVILSMPIYPIVKDYIGKWVSIKSSIYLVCVEFVFLSLIFFLLFLCVIKIASGSHNPFIYFRF
jgi:alginate O-acetyltransferase complex protein AlgI